MPRDLADVLHYFLPELDSDPPDETPPPSASPERRRRTRPQTNAATQATTGPPLPVLGLPIGDRDVVRAALAWNLAVETARLGAATALVVPESDRRSPLWPAPGEQPLGCELVFSPARNLDQLERHAGEIAERRSSSAARGGIVFTRIPPDWLTGKTTDAEAASTPPSSAHALRWLLLLTSAHRQDLRETHTLARDLAHSHPGADIGVTIHGVSAISEARNAFEYLARVVAESTDAGTPPTASLVSYGLLVDDLHVYRAIAAQRPIGLAHPQAPATRALMDVARLLYEDARSRVLG